MEILCSRLCDDISINKASGIKNAILVIAFQTPQHLTDLGPLGCPVQYNASTFQN